MSKKGNLSILSKRIVEGSEKNRVGVCSVYKMRHCLQGPCQGQQAGWIIMRKCALSSWKIEWWVMIKLWGTFMLTFLSCNFKLSLHQLLSLKSIPCEDIGERIIAAFDAFRIKAEEYYTEKCSIDWDNSILFPPQLYTGLEVMRGHTALQESQPLVIRMKTFHP